MAPIDFSPDGQIIATGGPDAAVRLWDLATRNTIGQPLTGHTSAVYTVAFSPNGRKLATAGQDKTTRIWSIASPSDLLGAACAVAGHTMTLQEWKRFVPTGSEFRTVCP